MYIPKTPEVVSTSVVVTPEIISAPEVVSTNVVASTPNFPIQEIVPTVSAEVVMTPEVMSENVEDIFSPEQVRPFPKASPRKNVNKGKKERKSEVLTEHLQ